MNVITTAIELCLHNLYGYCYMGTLHRGQAFTRRDCLSGLFRLTYFNDYRQSNVSQYRLHYMNIAAISTTYSVDLEAVLGSSKLGH